MTVTVTPVSEHWQKMIDYKVAEARFINRWAGRPLKCWLFKKRYNLEKGRLLQLFPSATVPPEQGALWERA